MNRIVLVFSVLCVLLLSTAYADDRRTVIKDLNNIDNNWPESKFKSWINRGDSDTLRVGEQVVFNFMSNEKAYLTILHVDAYGVINVSFPLMTENGEQTLAAGKKRLFPGRNDGFAIQVEPPMGRDSIYVVATKQALDKQLLGLSPDETSIPVEEAKLFMHDLNRSLIGNRVAIAKIEQRIVGRNAKVGYNENDIVGVFEKQATTRTFSRRKSSKQKRSNQKSLYMPPENQVAIKAKLNLYINFESGSDQLTATGKSNLDQVGRAFQRKSLSHKKYVLAGHTDDVGDEGYNLSLSDRRSKTVKSYLVSRYQISPSRITTIGYGEDRPIEAGTDAFSRAANRRVEIEEWQAGMSKPVHKPEVKAVEQKEKDGTEVWLD